MARSRTHSLLACILLALLLCAVVMPATAGARAGGGQSSNPGFTPGDDVFEDEPVAEPQDESAEDPADATDLEDTQPATLRTPSDGSSGGDSGGCLIPLAVIIGIGVLIVVFGKRTKTGPPASKPVRGPLEPVNFDSIKASDPDFSEQSFYGRVTEMFMEVQQSWQNRDMGPARRFLSPGQFEVLNNGVEELMRAGRINMLEGLHINRIEPVSVTSEGGSDHIKVLVTATVTDHTIDERTRQVVDPEILGDGKTPKSFQEYWILERKVGAHTKADATIKKCPNCGGPVTDGNYVKCAYCGTQMNDPALDWVLLRIEQT